MKKFRIRRLQPGQYKRASIVICVLLMVSLLTYAEVIRPNQDAHSYVKVLDSTSQPLESCFNDLAKTTTELKIYYAPDVTLSQKRQDVATILKEVDTCQKELNKFETHSHDLANLHLSGFTPQYRQAKVYQRQAFDIVGQSNDVLNQYASMATFLSKYYDHIIAFKTYVDELQSNKFFLGTAQLNTMGQQASDLRQRATQIRTLEGPKEFNATKVQTADMLDTAATGFENTVKGYRSGNDSLADTGLQQVDTASNSYDSTIINLPFEQLIMSYIPKQVNQLPAKVSNLLSSSVE